MGWMTTATFLNDSWDVIRAEPAQAIEGIYRAGHDGGTVSVLNHVNPIEVMPTHHADDFRLYASWQNSTIELDSFATKTLILLQRGQHTHTFVEACIREAEFRLKKLKQLAKETKA